MDEGVSYHLYNLTDKFIWKNLIMRRGIQYEQRYFYEASERPGLQGSKKYFECHELSGHCRLTVRTYGYGAGTGLPAHPKG